MNESEMKAEEAAKKLAAEKVEAEKAEAEKKLAAVEADKKNDPVEQLKERARMFKAEFGTKGVEWFLSDMTYEQAQKQYAVELKTKVDVLEKENAELKAAKATTTVAVGVAPVTASAPVVDADTSAKTFAQLVEEEVTAFSAKGQTITRTQAMRSVALAHPEAYARTRGGKR